MPNTPNDDLAKKAEAMEEFRRFRDAGLPVPLEVRARHVWATNDGYATGPDQGQRIPAFSLPDQNGVIRSLKDLAGPTGLLLVFHRSAHWCQYCRSQLVELELSRALLERNGVCVAAVSYDSPEILAAFAQKHSIGYPLLSDHASETIRSFGIFNENMAPHLKAYGVPHPVEYLVSADGTVWKKYFVPNYMNRVSGSAVALYEFSTVAEDAPIVTLKTDVLTASIGFPALRAFSGQELGFFAKFVLEPGWHIYGAPLPQGHTATAISFEDTHIARQSFRLPESHNMPISLLGETLPVYSGNFEGTGTLLLKNGLPEGMIALKGHLDMQQCSDTVCEPPLRIPFEVSVKLEPFVVNERERKLLEQQEAQAMVSRG